MKTYFYIRNSKITNPKVIRQAFDELKDGRYSMEILGENKRSPGQNGYFHGVLVPLVYEGLRDIGWNDIKTKEDAKLVIKTLFLKRKITNPESGDVIEVIKDTRDLTTGDMTQLIEDVIQWGAEYLGIRIPPPNSQTKLYE